VRVEKAAPPGLGCGPSLATSLETHNAGRSSTGARGRRLGIATIGYDDQAIDDLIARVDAEELRSVRDQSITCPRNV